MNICRMMIPALMSKNEHSITHLLIKRIKPRQSNTLMSNNNNDVFIIYSKGLQKIEFHFDQDNLIWFSRTVVYYLYVKNTRGTKIHNYRSCNSNYTASRVTTEICLSYRSPDCRTVLTIQDLTCKRGSVGLIEGLLIPRSSVWFRLKPRELKFPWIWTS